MQQGELWKEHFVFLGERGRKKYISEKIKSMMSLVIKNDTSTIQQKESVINPYFPSSDSLCLTSN